MLQQHRFRARRVVVIGFGPVAARLVDELLPAVREHRVQLLVIGAEPEPAYNRIMIGELALGRTDRDLMMISDPAALAAAGVHVRLAASVVAIDRERRFVTLSGGDQFSYDALVFATGAAARVPPLAGLPRTAAGVDPVLPDGVAVLRDLVDADRVAAMAGAGDLVVLGGGVLGMELALAAAEQGVATRLVHTGQVPMERNLDRTSAAIVARHLRRERIGVIADARAESVRLQHGRFTGLVLSDGRVVEGPGLVLCCGAQPRTALAVACGLPVDRGIVVDHDLRSAADPCIYAIGDCAQIRCQQANCADCIDGQGPTGLIGPGWAQAEQLAATLIEHGGPMNHLAPASSPVMVIKAPRLSVVSAGTIESDPVDTLLDDGGLRVSQWSDPAAGRYAKIITRGGVLEGLICVGLPRTAAELTLLYERRAELPADRSALLRHDGPDHAVGGDPVGPDAIVCRCNGVTAGQITDAICAGHDDLPAISRATRAGTGCGTCTTRICDLLNSTTEAMVTT